jgi:hypothetical protein
MRHVAGDREALALGSVEELWSLLPVFLEEIYVARPEKCYVGQHPPMPSSHDEPAIGGKELWPFAWDSARMGKRMYIKFILTKNRQDEWFYHYIDCHPDQPKKRK